MHITITEKFRPYSHTNGMSCMIPGTTYCLRVFPAFIQVLDLQKSIPQIIQSLPLQIEGPLLEFTVQQDLDRGFLSVWGRGKNFYYRYRCYYSEKGEIAFEADKGVSSFSIPSVNGACHITPSEERLSLGSNKAQEWDAIRRRCKMEEIFPLWFRLGLQTPFSSSNFDQGTFCLLKECKDAIDARKKLSIIPSFTKLYLAGFDLGLVPRLQDDEHQGIPLAPIDPAANLSPLSLLSEGAKLIRSLFINEGEVLNILPCLPPEFHCGRLIKLQSRWGEIDLEWSKKTIRRMILRAKESGEFQVNLQKEIQSYRLRCVKEKEVIRKPADSSLAILSGREYYLDNFQ